MPALQEQHGAHDAPPPFRLDVQLHDLLKKSPAPRPILVPGRQAEKFPEPVFPQHPELMAQDDNYEENLERRSREAPLACPAGLPRDEWVALPIFQITPVAGAISSDHCLPFYGMEMQSRFPLLLGFRQ